MTDMDDLLEGNHNDPSGLIRYLLATMREHQRRLDEHEKRISQLERRLSQFESPELWIYQPEFSLC
jgi:sugar-specific transcriptional regulator TrmB